MLRFNRHSFLILVSVIGVMFVAKNYLLFSYSAPVVLTQANDIAAARNALVILKSIKQGSWAGLASVLSTSISGQKATTAMNQAFTSLKTGTYASVGTNLDNAIMLLANVLPAASADVLNHSFSTQQMQGFSGTSNDNNIKYIKNTLFSNTTAGVGKLLEQGSSFRDCLSSNSNITEEMITSFVTASKLLGLNIIETAAALKTAAQRGGPSSTTIINPPSKSIAQVVTTLVNNSGRRGF